MKFKLRVKITVLDILALLFIIYVNYQTYLTNPTLAAMIIAFDIVALGRLYFEYVDEKAKA